LKKGNKNTIFNAFSHLFLGKHMKKGFIIGMAPLMVE